MIRYETAKDRAASPETVPSLPLHNVESVIDSPGQICYNKPVMYLNLEIVF